MTELSARSPGGPAVQPDAWPATASRRQRFALVDLLDRVLAGGVVVAGEVTLSVADVDIVTVSLRALVTSVSALARPDARPRSDAEAGS